jgi:hypothetical protein
MAPSFISNWIFISIAQGLLATVIMDAVAIALMVRGLIKVAPYGPVPQLLGRWILGFSEGRLIHNDILASPALSSEIRVGWIAHYMIGGALGWFFGYLAQGLPSSHWPSLGIAFGIATCILPWCLMFPALGFGFFARRIPITRRLLTASLLNHFIFGCGLAFASRLIG